MAKSAGRKTSEAVATAVDRSAKVLTGGSAQVTDSDVARRAHDLYLACDRKRERIETALNRIRPLLKADGVDVEIVEVRDNGASVRLTGLCARCGTGPLNFYTGLEAMLREEIEGFGELRFAT
jgi:Fe-S cluster biogenesis protein NfuA